ncbi:lipase 1 precursor [Ophiostoma piceae UAMH 11346]|uniref:Lipase 1 n=1 Tax=Ophiostoma piceae (strain UAMH 11346) TaxID=1262450 RepID=S3CA73_OPHP1|nr:lipase 1 precursor [Ophiostoma piceae UAMH 11346]
MTFLRCIQNRFGVLRLLLLGLVLVHGARAVHTDPSTGKLVRYSVRPRANSVTGNYLPPPTADAWYKAPEGWQSAKPGDVLRIREHAYPTINIPNAIDTFQVLYRTSDSLDNASWSVATVYIPKSHRNCLPGSNATKSGCSHAMVVYDVPSDSVSPDAAPGYLLQFQEPYGEMRDMLARGWFIMVPDYEGPEAAFCAGVQAGHATLDATRAVLKVAGQFGLEMDRVKVGMWGYSGGAFAVGFASELAETYAPELVIDAAVVGGSSPNISKVDERMNKATTAGLFVTSLYGATVQQPEAHAFLLKQLRTEGLYNKTKFLSALTMTGAEVLGAFWQEDIFNYLENGRDDFDNPIIQSAIDRDAVMGLHGTPRIPSFYYKAVYDELSPVNETSVMIDDFCRHGANILFHQNTIGGHNDELWTGRLRALDYLTAKLEGKVGNSSGVKMDIPATGCVTQTVSLPLETLYLLPDWWWTTGPGLGQGLFPK